MGTLSPDGRTVLITGASRRIGRALALASARAGADVIIHYRRSRELAEETRQQVVALGRRAWTVHANLSNPDGVRRLANEAFALAQITGLVNNAAIFGDAAFRDTDLETWDSHLALNLTAPMVLGQALDRATPVGSQARIINVLDWRAVRPGADHFAYTVSKAALAAMTKSMALAMAPRIMVNGLALGAILPPEGNARDPSIIKAVPAGRWGTLNEVEDALNFLLTGPAYITGEIIYVDGGRHLS